MRHLVVKSSSQIHIGFYTIPNALLNLFSDKMRDLPSSLLLFRNVFNKSINTMPRTLDSVYHMTLHLL